MKLDPASVWSVVHAERARLVADLRGLPHGSWSTPSLCAGWTVHDVFAHLLDTAHTSRIKFVRRMIATRAIDLLVAASGRPVAIGAFEGPGAPRLATSAD